jgi:hypothetical protein
MTDRGRLLGELRPVAIAIAILSPEQRAVLLLHDNSRRCSLTTSS